MKSRIINPIKIFMKSFAPALIISVAAFAAFAAAPPNDNFANAEVVSGMQVHIVRSNLEATKEASEPNHANNVGGKSVWFKWTAPMSRIMSITTNRSADNLDTLLHVYHGNSLNALASDGGSSNIYYPQNARSFVRFTAVEGITYYIAVDGYTENKQPAAAGTFSLDIQPSFPFQGADFDNDGMTDFAFFRPSNGNWNVDSSASGLVFTRQWGKSGDIPLAYSNSNTNEYAVFRPSDGVWYQQPVCCTSNAYLHWGTSGDIPVPANFEGTTNTQAAVFRPSDGAWYIYRAENVYDYYRFGQTGDIPLPGQYSPDLFADIAVFRPSNGTWYFAKRVSNNHAGDYFSQVQFGLSGDKPVPADYDGDGILDVAVYRPSTGVWYVLRSSDNQVQAVQFGIAEDVPTTGDFDGDGKFDYAVFRSSTAVWYVLRSGDNSAQIKQFGQSGDVPVTSNRTF